MELDVDLEIELLGLDDLESFVSHLVRHIPESGRGGAPIYNPYSRFQAPNPERFREKRSEGWQIPLDQPRWIRTWGARDGQRIVGHAELHGGVISTESHRASLGMGVHAAFRRRGLGRRLLEACVEWAREQGLVWLDLGVFADNAPARALYESAGFAEVGRREDRFRIDGHSICDIQMSLRLS